MYLYTSATFSIVGKININMTSNYKNIGITATIGKIEVKSDPGSYKYNLKIQTQRKTL